MVQTSFFLMVKQLMPKKEVICSMVSKVNFMKRMKVAVKTIPAIQLSGNISLFVAPANW
jgi:hypothetical protein